MHGGAVIRGWLDALERTYPFAEWSTAGADGPSREPRPVPQGREVGDGLADLRPEVTAVGDSWWPAGSDGLVTGSR